MAQKISLLPVGAKIKFGKYQVETETPQPIIWQIADKNHIGYPENSTTLITERIIDLRAFDGSETGKMYGDNRYLHSNIRQWLNKSGLNWFVAQHSDDAPPTDGNTMNFYTGYDDKKGFLSSFTTEELAVILPTTLTVVKNNVIGGGSEIFTDMVFLPSATEMGITVGNSIIEGSGLNLFKDSIGSVTYLTQQCFDNTKSTSKPTNINSDWEFWLRTPVTNGSSMGNLVCLDIDLKFLTDDFDYVVRGEHGICPALNVTSDVLVSDSVDSDGCYVVTLPYIITLNKLITISSSDVIEGKNLSVKTGGMEMSLVSSDSEKMIYKGSTNETVELEIKSKGDQSLDKVAYTVS